MTRSLAARLRLSSLSIYLELSKSGIVTLVLISVLGGYLIGQPSEAALDPKRMILSVLGVLFLASGSSALNQLQDLPMDSEMSRTAGRPLPTGRIAPSSAIVFILTFIALGLVILYGLGFRLFLLGLLAVFLYNGLYTLWWKRHWAYAAVPGALPGAIPILIGYVAASGRLDPAGFYLFSILFFWQMPHFWVLALRYKDDYAKGGVPTLPVAHGEGVTIQQIVLWCLAYVGLLLLAPLFLKVRTTYLVVIIATSAKVLWELKSWATDSTGKNWIRFFLWINFSLIIALVAAAADLWSVFL